MPYETRQSHTRAMKRWTNADLRAYITECLEEFDREQVLAARTPMRTACGAPYLTHLTAAARVLATRVSSEEERRTLTGTPHGSEVAA